MKLEILDHSGGGQVRKLGKSVRGDLYIHVTALDHIGDPYLKAIERAISIAKIGLSPGFNVVKISRDGKSVSLLLYPGFFDDAFPTLARSATVNIMDESVKLRTYNPKGNPPILHKKELLLDPTHPQRSMFELLTKQLQSRNIKPNKPGLGLKKQWEAYLCIMGVAVENHQLSDL